MNLSYEETFGLTTIEGMSCGTPGIVYNCTASPELISESTGLIVEPGNILMLNEAINTILNKGKEYYFSKCRQRVEDLFNIEDRHQEYMNLYDSLLNCNN